MRLLQQLRAPLSRSPVGAAVSISSSAGRGTGAYGAPEYAVAKAGLIRLTTALADWSDRFGVRVACVAPGWIGLPRAIDEVARDAGRRPTAADPAGSSSPPRCCAWSRTRGRAGGSSSWTRASPPGRSPPRASRTRRSAPYPQTRCRQTAADDRIDALLAGLNEPQREAVVHGEGPLLILAGAGSGKTRVLTHRIAYLVQHRAGPARARSWRSPSPTRPRRRCASASRCCSAHSTRGDVGHDLPRRLRADAARRGAAPGLHAPVHDLRPGRLAAAGQALHRRARHRPQALHARRRCTTRSPTPRTSCATPRPTASSSARSSSRPSPTSSSSTSSGLHRMNAMDFDDLLVRTVNVLELFPEVRARYSARLPLRAGRRVPGHEPRPVPAAPAAGGRGRTATSRSSATTTSRSTASAAPTSATSSTSRTTSPTRRSCGSSRTTARRRRSSTRPTRVIAHNRGRMGKTLWTDLGRGRPDRVRELDDEHAEARYVVGEIERMVDEGVSRAEIAVFYRTNAQSRVLEDTLVRREIGYQVIGGTKFYERAEIKDAIAYLTVLANPQDVVSFTRMANSPQARDRPDVAVARDRATPRRWASRCGTRPPAPATVPGLGHRGGPGARALHGDDGRAARPRRAGRARSATCWRRCCDETGYVDALEAERTIEAQGRLENLQELVEVAREFDAHRPRRPRTRSTSSCSRSRSWPTPTRARDDEGLVTLMTLHNAKGLEYPIVFMIGCEEGVFPHSRSIDEGSLEEERRLCYVGITRAERDLTSPTPAGATSSARRASGCPAASWPSCRPTSSTARARSAASPGRRRRGRDDPAPRDRLVGGDALGRGADRPPSGWATTSSHAAFGEGVVTGVEPGGIVVVRFAQDGTERKLMAEYAPITRRGGCSYMPARVIDGRAVAAQVRAQVAARGRRPSPSAPDAGPGLATVLVGDDPASAVYVGGKQKASREVGHRRLRPSPARRHARGGGRRARSSALNADDEVSGILVQLPGARSPRRRAPHRPGRPGQGRRRPDARERRAARARAPGPAPVHAAGVMELLAHAGARLRGRRGRRRRALEPLRQADGPAAARGATRRSPTAHSRTRDLAAVCRRADVLIAAVGRAGLVRGDWVKPGRDGDRRGHRTAPPTASRVTSTSPRSPRWPARSRPCPAASGR